MESSEWKTKGLTLTKHHWYTKLLLGSIDSSVSSPQLLHIPHSACTNPPHHSTTTKTKTPKLLMPNPTTARRLPPTAPHLSNTGPRSSHTGLHPNSMVPRSSRTANHPSANTPLVSSQATVVVRPLARVLPGPMVLPLRVGLLLAVAMVRRSRMGRAQVDTRRRDRVDTVDRRRRRSIHPIRSMERRRHTRRGKV